jgi:hypothetical protein
VIAVLPALLIPLSHAKGEDFIFVLGICLSLGAMLVALSFKYGFYMRRTPLVRINEASLTFFGNARSQQRTFQRHAISGISLSGRPYFWRSAFRFSVVAEGETVDLWIPHSSRGSISALARALRQEFPGKFEEVLA